MPYDEERTIIQISSRYGDNCLNQFFQQYTIADRVEMIRDAGYGEQLAEWFREEYPKEFYQEDTTLEQECEMEFELERERRLVG